MKDLVIREDRFEEEKAEREEKAEEMAGLIPTQGSSRRRSRDSGRTTGRRGSASSEHPSLVTTPTSATSSTTSPTYTTLPTPITSPSTSPTPTISPIPSTSPAPTTTSTTTSERIESLRDRRRRSLPLKRTEIGRAVQQECRDRSRMPSSA
eukprot:TRINITY_DN9648_c0_g1_i4.p1 TRINITY_DN9648_c0_g1~~TRINITY_DN9648_c0_g1_i4.p1  ORF type:complete len:166 (-),score=22.06 TRINITY_DN9648_c0_g1_i4:11-463(-)